MKPAIRIQIIVQSNKDKKLAEAIVEDYDEANRMWARWCALRYSRNEPLGGAAYYRVDISRLWNG